jgi:EAL domain-containing protein (putative c-di-GMP-specific phosphodiesterase class I)
MDGVEVMDEIHGATADDDFVPIVLLTADATSDARERALAAGASDFLTKPLDRTEVVLRARNLMHTRKLHRHLRNHNARLREEIAERDAADREAFALASETVRRLYQVLEDGLIQMVFQPIARLESGTVAGYESLARFELEPRRPPNVWFEEAAGVGLGADLELAAVGHALAALPTIVEGGGFLTVNVSPETAMTSALADLLATHQQDRIVLEITEHAQVDDYEGLLEALGRLRGAGVRLAVDDAGAGFASLHHILLLQPEVIKLDITLVRDINDDPIKRALASSLVRFAREIESTIVAEGIETPAELATLIDLGVPLGQGYHLGRPGPLAP